MISDEHIKEILSPLLLDIIVIVFLLFTNRFLLVLVFPVYVPLRILSLQKRESRFFATVGLFTGGVLGFLLGSGVTDALESLIIGDMSRYNIRIDLFFGGLLGASIFSSIGVIIGAKLNKPKDGRT